YIRILLNFGQAAVHGHTYSELRNYMDLSAFSSLLPGGRSGVATAILGIVSFTLLARLIHAWFKSFGGDRKVNTLVWAATITWTLVLNVYVPIYDSILAIPGVIATAAILESSGANISRGFTVLWAGIYVCSWISTNVAGSIGLQILTILYGALGTLQL